MVLVIRFEEAQELSQFLRVMGWGKPHCLKESSRQRGGGKTVVGGLTIWQLKLVSFMGCLLQV